MKGQVAYYNSFGTANRSAILNAPEPHLWTTDYEERGRIYQEMCERLALQEQLIDQYFSQKIPVLDVGCGFGRQAYLLAKKEFGVTGTDTSPVFIDIAKDLFKKNNLQGNFLCTDFTVVAEQGAFSQVLLLDVLEHVPSSGRKEFVKKLVQVTAEGGLLIISLPLVKKRWRSQVNNSVRKRLTQHLRYFKLREEHPYPIPQRQDVQKLFTPYFQQLDLITSPNSDYYVFKKL